MTIEPFKYLIQPVAIERGEDGRITRELPGETLSVFNVDDAVKLITEFERLISEQQTGEVSENGRGREDRVEDHLRQSGVPR